MKFLIIILTTTILFLAFKPGVDAIILSSSSMQSCCVETCDALPMADSSQNDENNGNCSGNSCNPFQSCGTSFLLSLNTPETFSPDLQVSTKRNFTYQSIYSSQFISDFWHPPKFV